MPDRIDGDWGGGRALVSAPRPFDDRDPATVDVTPEPFGGLTVNVNVPSPDGAIFTISVERDNDGNWRVYIPWTLDEDAEPVTMADGHECCNGIVYIAAPETTW